MIGNVYIACMNMRGKWAEPPDNCIVINVCSSQAKNSKNRRDFSPMTEIVGGYKGYWNFESYWQSGKVFQDLDNHAIKLWWQTIKEPKRRHPKTKGKKVLYAKFDNLELDYVASRKQIYIPEYYDLIKDREMTLYWKNKVANGKNVVIYDFDGPRLENGDVTCLLLTEELLTEKMNDTTFSFGHGYIVGSLLADIDILNLL